jgi:hypothetical protein
LNNNRNIKNTLIDTRLIKSENDEEYVSKVARTIEEACGRRIQLCKIEDAKLFRNHK